IGTRLLDPILNELAEETYTTTISTADRVSPGYTPIALPGSTSKVLTTLTQFPSPGSEFHVQLGVLDVTRNDGWDSARAIPLNVFPAALDALLVPIADAVSGEANAVGVFFGFDSEGEVEACVAAVTAP